MEKNIIIYVLSDSIGETGELLSKAALSQFNSDKYEIRKVPYITDKYQIEEVMEEAKNTSSIIIYTVVIEDLREYIEKRGKALNIATIDLMSPALDAIAGVLGYEPRRESGLIRKLDDNYFKKVEAVEFAVKYDDGKDPRGIKQADIVLVGISRTSKTPLSMYLAHKNYKVANVPLVPEVGPPGELFQKEKSKIIGLVAEPLKINEIRRERLKTLGLDNEAIYGNIDRINQELEYSRSIMEKLDCFVIDVTNKAIEETAGLIIDYIKSNPS